MKIAGTNTNDEMMRTTRQDRNRRGRIVSEDLDPRRPDGPAASGMVLNEDLDALALQLRRGHVYDQLAVVSGDRIFGFASFAPSR